MQGARGAISLALVAVLLPAALAAQTAVPVGAQFQVNSFSTNEQRFPAVAVDVSGNFMVVWDSYGSSGGDTSYHSIQSQRFNADGSPIGSQFQVNTYTPNEQRFPAVAVDPSGRFAVVWQSYGAHAGDRSSYSIQSQRFDSNGNPAGSQFLVNSYSTNAQRLPRVAVDPSGNFVVVWQSLGSSGGDTIGYSVQGQRFDANGNPIGAQFQVNSGATDDEKTPAVAVDSSGNFVVVWATFTFGGPGFGIRGRRFNANGDPTGSEFQVNSYSTIQQYSPDVAVDPSGNFVAVWASTGSNYGDNDYSIEGQRFDSNGNRIATQFRVNSYTPTQQANPAVAVDPSGDFVVLWHSLGSSGGDADYSIQGQLYDANGNPAGSQFQVSSYTTGAQHVPRVAIDPSGDFVVVWESYGSSGGDTESYSVQGQRYRISPHVLFVDGFESGNASRWSFIAP